MIVNPSFRDYGAVNVAENFSQPVDYFNFGDNVKRVPIFSATSGYINDELSMIIIGGGGIFKHKKKNTWYQLREIVDRTPVSIPVIIWGMGINDHNRLDRNYNETLSYLEAHKNVLIGLRDSFYKTYVPCVSCMRKEFDSHFEIKHRIVSYMHYAHYYETSYPTMLNKLQGEPVHYFRRVIQFLGSSEIVITNTYHGAYWATLLKRKVIVIAPFSNKFLGFKHEPVIIQDLERMEEVTHLAKSYDNALSECREANLDFSQKVVLLRSTLARCKSGGAVIQ